MPEGIFHSERCPCGAGDVPTTSPYCEACLDQLAAALSDVLRGGEADAE